jgi:hypothetical protein
MNCCGKLLGFCEQKWSCTAWHTFEQRSFLEPKWPFLEPAHPSVAASKTSTEQISTRENFLGPGGSPPRCQGKWHSVA